MSQSTGTLPLTTPPLVLPGGPTGPGAAVTGSAYLVRIVPSDEGERQAEAMETWLQACASDEPFTLELVGTSREQGFLLRASSAEQLRLLTKQFAAQYPQAELERLAPQHDPLVLRTGEQAVTGTFALARPSWLPLKTFTGKALAESGNDPLAGILAAMEVAGPGERIVCQLALVHAPDDWIAPNLRKAVEHPLQAERDSAAASRYGTSGQTTSDSEEGVKLLAGMGTLLLVLVAASWYREGAWGWLTLLGGCTLVGGGGLAWWWIHHRRRFIYDMRLVAEKLVRTAFYTQLRVVVIGPHTGASERTLRGHLTGLEVAYRQFSLASANSLTLKRVARCWAGERAAVHLPLVDAAFPYRNPFLRLLHGGPGKDYWNGLELAGAFHLPQESADLPLVRRISVKHLLFPPEIAFQVEQAPAPLPPTSIGTSTQRGHTVRVRLPFATLFRHTFLVGRSRSGKSVLMQLLATGAMQRVCDTSLQPGLFCIDPHRDLVEDLLQCLPPERAADVLLLDLTDPTCPVGINPFDATMGFTRDQAVANFISSSRRIWADFWGPRMEYFLKQVCQLLYTLNEQRVKQGRAHTQYTLLDINPILQSADYAATVLQELDTTNPWHRELLAWWQTTYFSLPQKGTFKQEILMPILSKMGVFSDNELLRRIVGQPVTTAPVHQAITTGKIVLCALSGRDLDEGSINILGSTLINLLYRAFGTQHDLPLQERRRVFVAIDEFQSFSGGSYESLLSESAKFGCAMLLSTQSLSRLKQLKDGLLETALSNCENLCVFNVSAADAKLLVPELREQVSVKHLLSQPRLHCYARLALPDLPIQIASVALDAPGSWHPAPGQATLIAAIRQRSVAAVDRSSRQSNRLDAMIDVDLVAHTWQRNTQSMQNNARRKERTQAQHSASLPASASPAQATSADGGNSSGAGADPPAAKAGGEQGHGGAAGEAVVPGQAPGSAGPAASAEGGGSSRTDAVPAASAGSQKRTRSRRMQTLKRVAKSPVGVPPPDETNHNTLLPGQESNAPDERRILPPSALRATSSGNERGERER